MSMPLRTGALALNSTIAGFANPESSTGRLDLLTEADHTEQAALRLFDDHRVGQGYQRPAFMSDRAAHIQR